MFSGREEMDAENVTELQHAVNAAGEVRTVRASAWLLERNMVCMAETTHVPQFQSLLKSKVLGTGRFSSIE